MENLIPIINELQNVFTAVGSAPIQLPQLVVVGSQSSGKSSVLEHIVGRDFLPRGTGIVTRRPLILQLIHVDEEDDDEEEGEDVDDEEEGERTRNARNRDNETLSNNHITRRRHQQADSKSHASSSSVISNGVAEEWGEFLHIPGRKFYDFNQIREEIVRETDRVTGTNKGISSLPINLKLYSPHVLNLTLVDLPGITKVSIGDQPPDIEMQIQDLILNYISNPHSIIIAVSPANADIANSDSLKLARQVDPTGMRTLGVITKIDLMDHGTDASALLVGQVVDLQHGFVAVRCRSQEAILRHQPIREALQTEKEFFANHPAYKPIANRLGTPYLARKLSALLMNQIQTSLPEIRNKISTTIAETISELESYGTGTADGEQASALLLPLLSKFCDHLSAALDGRSPEVSLTELYGGARISYIFTSLFGQVLESMTPLDNLSDQDIRISIRNASGPRPALFIPEVCFELLVSSQIQRLLSPALDCVDLVYHEMQRVAFQCEMLCPELVRFPLLRTRLMEVFQEMLKSAVQPTRQHIENLISCELAFINTSHQDFIGGNAAIATVMERINAKAKQPQQQQPSKGSLVADGDGHKSHKGASHDEAHARSHAQAHARSISSNPQFASHSSAASTASSAPSSSSSSSSSTSSNTSSTTSNTAPSVRAGSVSSGWSFPFFNRGSQPSSSPNAQTSSAAAYGARESERRRISGGHTHPSAAVAESMLDHDLYSGHAHTALASLTSSTRALSSSSSTTATAAALWPLKSLESSDRELIEIEVIKLLMSSYFSIVKKSVSDQVPKSIMCFLVNKTKKGIQAELVRQLYKSESMEQLMQEAPDIAEKRQACQELLAILHRAMEIINHARDFNAMTQAV